MRLEWKVTAVIDESSVAFASELQSSLNTLTAEGYSLAHMFVRGAGHDMILVHQRTTLVPDGAPTTLESTIGTEGNGVH